MAESREAQSRSLDDILAKQGLKREDVDKECSQAIRFEIAMKITDWKMAGHYLSIPSQTLRDIKIENETEDERRIVLLQTWHKREGRKATYYRLLEALHRLHRRDLVEDLCGLIKSHRAALTIPREEQPQKDGPGW